MQSLCISNINKVQLNIKKETDKMKKFSVQIGNGSEGRDGRPAVGPIYRNILCKNECPPPHPDLYTAWDSFRYFPYNSLFL